MPDTSVENKPPIEEKVVGSFLDKHRLRILNLTMKVAVVGSGCSGLGATWALNEYSDHQVHLYDSDSRPGGHANTVLFTNPKNGETTMVDTGFIVFNPPSYPNFHRFLHILGVKTVDTEMTFALTRDGGKFEWAGDTLFTLFCQPANLFKSSMWRMIWDILRFNASARRLVVESEKDTEEKNATSIGEYLDRNGYSESFRDDYLIPMTAAIWSTPPSECAEGFTARSLLRFMHNHHLLQIIGKPKWNTIIGGSIEYVNRVTSKLPKGALRLGSAVTAVSSSEQIDGKTKVILRTADGRTEEYDRVVLACHSGTAMQLLSNGGLITPDEKFILGGYQWTQNRTVLHSDISALPKCQNAWSSWNYVTESQPAEKGGKGRNNSDQFAFRCSDLMNTLQLLDMDRFGPIICTLNPTLPLAEESIQARAQYEHPTFNAVAERSQRAMPSIQNTRGISYAGAWMGYGFHEDGFTAGLNAAVALGDVKLPFDIRPPDRRVTALWTADVFDVLEGFRRLVSSFLWALLVMVGIMF